MTELPLPPSSAEVLKLPDGLEVIVLEDASAPVASVQAWVRTGSIHEGSWLGAGLSHFLEHMLFKGTHSRGPQDFARTVQEHGGYINAYTSFDQTVYWVDIPAGGVATAIELLADALMDSTLPEAEFAKEQEVIRREFAMGNDDPDSVAGKQLFATAFAVHPMRHPVIGHRDIFDRLTRDDLAAYYGTRYAPNNIFFVVVGDVKADSLREQFAALFTGSPRRPLADVPVPREPAQTAMREQHTEFETQLARLGLAWHIPEVTHADLPALDVLSTVLGSGRSSRLHRRLREGLAIVHGIDAWCYATPTAGLLGVDAVLEASHVERATTEVRDMIRSIQDSGVAGAELEKARRQFLSHQFQALTTMRGRARSLGANWLATRDLDFDRACLAAAGRVTSDDLARVARRYLTTENLTLSTLVPPGTIRRSVRVAVPHSSGNIEHFELPNGLRLLVREDRRLPLVSMVASFKGGLLAETAADNGISRLMSRSLLKGTASRSAEDIASSVEAAGGVLGTDSGNNSLSVSARFFQPDLALGIGTLADVILHATFPAAEVARERDAQLAAIRADDEEPTSAARNLLRARLFGSHPFALRMLGTPATLAALDAPALSAFRDRHFVGSNGVLAIYGAVHSDEALELANRHFAGLPRGNPALRDLPRPIPPAVPIEAVHKMPKEQAVLMIGYPAADIFSPDRVPLELLDEACSDLGSRMFTRIREEMGLAYFVGSSHLAGLAPGMFSFYAGTDPARAGDVRDALLDEIRRLAADGITPAELARAKAKLIGAQAIRNQSNDSLAFSCALDELYGLGYRHHETLRERVDAVTPDIIRETARRYFSQPPVIITVRP